MRGGGGGGGGSPDNSLDFLWIVIMAILLVILIWYFGHEYITAVLYRVKYYEIQGILYFLAYWNQLAEKWTFLPVAQPAILLEWKAAMTSIGLPSNMNTLAAILTDVGSYMRYPTAFVIGILAAILYSKNIVLKFKINFDMKKMRAIEIGNWPQITPIAKLNLVKEDINKGPWAMSVTPMQFCKKYNLLKEKKGDDGLPAVELIKGAAYEVFVMQLGQLWTHFGALPIYAKALFAAFAACANEDRASAFDLMHKIAASSVASGKLDFTGTEELLAKHYNSKLVVRVLQRHAYVYTVFASMLELARTDGVFASSEFLWLKPVDRRLWYVLNTIGRQTPVPEAAGPFAHWMAEKKWGGALRSPMLDEAVKAMEEALSEIKYEPEEAR